MYEFCAKMYLRLSLSALRVYKCLKHSKDCSHHCINSYQPILRFVCNIEALIPRTLPLGFLLLYCIQSEGLVNNYYPYSVLCCVYLALFSVSITIPWLRHSLTCCEVVLMTIV